MTEKESFGVICYRNIDRGTEIILIKKPCTYSFINFITGRFNSKDFSSIERLLSETTYEEKRMIQYGSFEYMWKTLNYNDTNYKKYLKKYNNDYIKRNDLLMKALERSAIGSDIWEIPKGRKLDGESEIDAAFREFKEETNIDINLLHIELDRNPYIYSYIGTDGVRYKNTYYFAKGNINIIPILNFANKSQVAEVADIKWCNRNDIKVLTSNKHLERILNVFDIIDRMKKSYKKRPNRLKR